MIWVIFSVICLTLTTVEGAGFQCDPLKSPENGAVFCDNEHAQVKCEYRCDRNYALSAGSHHRTCGPRGQWSGDQPVCTSIILLLLDLLSPTLCPPMEWEAGGQGINCTAGNHVGSVCRLHCSGAGDGDDGEVVCLKSGKWSGALPDQCPEEDIRTQEEACDEGTKEILEYIIENVTCGNQKCNSYDCLWFLKAYWGTYCEENSSNVPGDAPSSWECFCPCMVLCSEQDGNC